MRDSPRSLRKRAGRTTRCRLRDVKSGPRTAANGRGEKRATTVGARRARASRPRASSVKCPDGTGRRPRKRGFSGPRSTMHAWPPRDGIPNSPSSRGASTPIRRAPDGKRAFGSRVPGDETVLRRRRCDRDGSRARCNRLDPRTTSRARFPTRNRSGRKRHERMRATVLGKQRRSQGSGKARSCQRRLLSNRRRGSQSVHGSGSLRSR